jgi:hypothetical protein
MQSFQCCYTSDEISLMSDDDLHRNYDSLKQQIEKGKRRNVNTKNLEVEACYLQRELKQRVHWSRTETNYNKDKGRPGRPLGRPGRPGRPHQPLR